MRSEDGIEVVGEAADGVEAVSAVRELRPDVVLMDVRMPRVDGIEATRQISAMPDPPRVLVLTTFDLDEYVFASLRAGASGFLLKDAPEAQLLAAIRVVADGGSLFAPGRHAAAYRALRERSKSRLRRRLRSTRSPPARPRCCGCSRAGRSNAEIAAELVVSEHTVKTHVAHVLAKLGLRDRIQAVILAYESGLVRPGV